MPAVLAFEPQTASIDGRRVRRARFELRSNLPVSAACVVANTVRETLAALLQTSVQVRLTEPIVPDSPAWDAILTGARCFGVRGPVCRAAFVLRPTDAAALAAAAFGEFESARRTLSSAETQMLQRVTGALAAALPHLSGAPAGAIERILDNPSFVTYFELLVEEPVKVRIGVALSRDPAPRAGPSLRIEDLGEVELEVRAEFARGTLAAADFLNLRPGAVVPMMTKMGEPGLLKLGAAAIGRGECGAAGERNVMVLIASA